MFGRAKLLKKLCKPPKVTLAPNSEADLVILGAWAGARAKPVRKYADMYAELGYSTMGSNKILTSWSV